MKNKKNAPTDLQKLATLRDELKLQIHLFSAEARQLWAELEKDWQLINFEIKDSKPQMKKIENALIQIREGIERHHKKVG
jgi:chromosome segregation ATPase